MYKNYKTIVVYKVSVVHGHVCVLRSPPRHQHCIVSTFCVILEVGKGGTTPASSNRPGIFETFVPLAQLVTVSKQGTTVG